MDTSAPAPATWQIGMTASLHRAFNDADVRQFAALSGDHNPVHLDEAAAAADPRFGARIVHGMLVASLFSTLLGEELPGAGTIYLGQELSFRAPVFLGEEIVASVELIEIRADKPIAKLRTLVRKRDGTICVQGQATVLLPARPAAAAAPSEA